MRSLCILDGPRVYLSGVGEALHFESESGTLFLPVCIETVILV